MFRGSMVALVTPFANGAVDLPRLRALIEFHIEAGTCAVVVAGTTGEAATLSFDEKNLVMKTAVAAANQRIPVIAGTAANATRDCITLTQLAMSCGVDAALIMTPAYIKPTQEGLYEHYSAIAHDVAIPIILYNVTQRTACDLLPETVLRLSHVPNIIGIKEANSDMSRFHALKDACAERMDIYSGDDATVAPWILAGAKGAISVAANVAPRHMAKLCDAGLDGDVELCMLIQKQLAQLNRLLFVETNPIGVKWALAQMGFIQDELRLPLTPLTPIHHAVLTKSLQELGLMV